MKKYIPICVFLALCLTSCVSKKKYFSLKQQHEKTLSEKSRLEEVLNNITVENDSLKKQKFSLDSLFRAEHDRSTIAAGKSISPGGSSKAKSSLSKAAEYDKKALYVYNLPNYIFWPKNVMADKFLIGVIGDSPLNAALGAYVYKKNIQMLPAVIEPYSPGPGKFYHMIFIAKNREKDFYKIKKDLLNKPVLLITENPYLEKVGAHICLYIEGDKVKFRVSKKAIEKNGLNVSEQLIKLADNQ